MNSLFLLDTFLLIIRVTLSFSSFVSAIDRARFKSCKNRKLDSVSLQTWKVKSRIQCADKCLGENACSSASYEAENNICELFNDVIQDEDCESLVYNNRTTFLIMLLNPCKNNQQFDGNACVCQAPLSGQYCEIGPRDCYGISGTRWKDIYPEDGIGKLTVFCWDDLLIIFTVPTNGLPLNMQNKNWDDFKNGFGNIDKSGYADGGGYWLGNDKVHRITNGSPSYKLQYDGDFPANKVGRYSGFVLDSESNNYTLHFSSYSSSYGMKKMLQNGIAFRTVNWNDNGCAGSKQTGFWFGMDCTTADVLFGSIAIDGVPRDYDDFWGSLVRV